MCAVVVSVAPLINIKPLLQEEEEPDFHKDVGLLGVAGVIVPR